MLPTRISRYTAATAFPSGVLLTHVVNGERLLLDAELATAVLGLRDEVFTDEELRARTGADEPLIRTLRQRGLLVAADYDEAEQSARFLGDRVSEGRWGRSRAFWRPELVTASPGADATSAPNTRTVRMLGFGGCVLDFAREDLEREGRRRGMAVSLSTRWPESPRTLAIDDSVDVVVLQLPVLPHLTRLLDNGPLAAPDERRAEVARMQRLYSRWIDALAEALPDHAVGLVHNLAPSALSPYGRHESAVDYNTRQVLFEINDHVDRALRRDGRLLLVDEERLTARHGALALADDPVFPFGHHGGAVDPGIEIAHQTPDLGRVLAAEYLDLYQAASGGSGVKCVVTDLDGTLWPGIAADDGFGWLDADATSTWMHLGLHQALKLLKDRGVLLATVSKGTEAATLGAWRQVRHAGMLTPDDFVLHRVNWRPKSENIAELAAAVGLAPEAILFLDDNPVERFEVARGVPGVRVLQEPVADFRAALLLSPLLDRPPGTEEARRRTETTGAMLRRAELAASGGDGGDLIGELDVVVEVFPAAEENLARVVELFGRTNQYTTTSWRPSEADISRLMREERSGLVACRVRDRFADYGLVGVAAFVEDRVVCVAVSCRVIGLDVGPVLLAAAARMSGRAEAGLRGRFVPTDRNQPAAGLFASAGLRPVDGEDDEDGDFELRAADDLRPIESFPHRVVLWTEPTGSGE